MDKEPKIKWLDSKARKLLYQDVMNGIVPLKGKDDGNKSTGKLKDILYAMRPEEFAEYDDKKFSGRLSSIRKTVLLSKSRLKSDRI